MFTTFPCTRRICGVVVAGAFAVAAAGVAGATTEPPNPEPADIDTVGTEAATAGPDTGANPAGCVESDAASGEQFPDQFTVQYAENYTLTYAENYKVLTVGETSPGAGAHTYVLVQCGTAAPALEGELEGASVVEIPVTTIFSESTSHLGFIDVLDLEGAVTGVSDGSWVVTPSIRERIDAGEVESFNTTMVVDTEMVVAADPDVYITAGYDDPAHEMIADAGVPVVADAEWLEPTPEGWAEWVGLFAALTNTEARANELYAEWVTDYEAAATLVEGVTEHPTVMTGGLYEGTWFASGGAGIAAELIADAGGDYIYDDNEDTGSIELDIETVLTEAAEADVWVLASSFTTEDEAEAADPRNTEFAAWDEGGVWINTVPSDTMVNPYEQGPVMIDEYLLDYLAVLHPGLAPDHDLVFFRRLPDE
jgi:iron complex transport system substrate-binding protein